MNRTVVAGTLIAAFAFLATGAARADADKGFYAGAGVGQFNVKIDDVDDLDNAIEKLDDSDTSWKAFVGWRFAPFFAAEVAYIDFGSPGDSFGGNVVNGKANLSLDGFAPYLIGTIPLGIFEIFGKVGYYFYNVDVEADINNQRFKASDSKEDLLYGVGAGVTFFEHLNVRLEYERIDVSEIDTSDALWLSGAWRF